MLSRGRFITFEGGEGAGKSTQIRRLEAWLSARGNDVVCTREPGGTTGAEAIRQLVVEGRADKWDAMTELLLMMAARQDHIQKVIRPALEAGRWVLSDRFHDSSRVYQGIAGGLGLGLVDKFHEDILAEMMPDLTVLIDLDPCIGLERRAQDTTTVRFEQKGTSFHQTVRTGFLELAKAEPHRFLIVDGHKPQDAVERTIREGIMERISGIGSLDG